MTDKPSHETKPATDAGEDAAQERKAAGLEALRGDIDRIDNALLDLLAQRQQVSRAIVTKKAPGSDVFRPDREVSLLRNLVASHKAIDARLIMGLWRHIISASIAEQKPDYTIAHSAKGKELADTHGAGYMRTSQQQDITAAISLLRAGEADCVIVTQDELDEHAHLLDPEGVVIAASIGFLVQDGIARGYIICAQMPLPTGDDRLVVRDRDNKLSHHDRAAFLQDKRDQLTGHVIVGQYATPLQQS